MLKWLEDKLKEQALHERFKSAGSVEKMNQEPKGEMKVLTKGLTYFEFSQDKD